MGTKDLISPELNAKVKKNLLRLFFVTVVMLFAGLTSAYLVSRGSSFWVSITLPDAFKISTLLLAISSLFLILAVHSVKKEKSVLLKISVTVALVTGAMFGYYQKLGFEDLFERGYGLSGPIIENSGRYGNIFTMTYEGKSLSFKDDQFYWKGEPISDELHSKINQLGEALVEKSKYGNNDFDLENYGSGFMIYYQTVPITYSNNQLSVNNVPLDRMQLREIYEFGDNLANDRGDFIMEGKYGEDFIISYGGTPLGYENRTFYLNGSPLSAKLQNDLNGAENTASSYIYVFTGMHLLHWIGGIIALIIVFIKGLLNKYTKSSYLGITLASTYWHFLGILWLYLYGFLIFIH